VTQQHTMVVEIREGMVKVQCSHHSTFFMLNDLLERGYLLRNDFKSIDLSHKKGADKEVVQLMKWMGRKKP